MAISIQDAAKIAKTRTTDKRWLNAIYRAVEGAATWFITELRDCLLITSDSGETYRVNGHCPCRAGVIGQPCKHLALRRLREIAATETAPAVTAPAPRITRSVERDIITRRRLHVVRCNDWVIKVSIIFQISLVSIV